MRLALLPVVVCLIAGPAAAQIIERSQNLPPAEVEQLDAAAVSHLENASRFLAAQQWAEAVEAIRRAAETEPARLVKVDSSRSAPGFERYVTAAEYCQWRLAALASEAPAALAHYRSLVDPLAEAWFQDGERTNDEALVRRVVEQAFASRYGDDALLKLGDLALARGEPALARAWWRRIAPSNSTGPLSLGVYPDSDLDPAAVQARLVLASIFEGSPQRAAAELTQFKKLFPPTEGQLAGRRGNYADLLQSTFDESLAWPAPRQPPG